MAANLSGIALGFVFLTAATLFSVQLFFVSSVSFFKTVFLYVKGARGIAISLKTIAQRAFVCAPLTNPRNPLKRLFGAVGIEAFRKKEDFEVGLF